MCTSNHPGPLAALSDALQSSSINFMQAMASLTVFYEEVKNIGVCTADHQQDEPEADHPPDEPEAENVQDSTDEPAAKRRAVEIDSFQSFWYQLQADGTTSEESKLEFKGVELELHAEGRGRGQVVNLPRLKRKILSLAEKVEECVRIRLGDINEESRLKVMRILDTRTWPTNTEDLLQYGVDDVKCFKFNFSSLVEAKGM